MSVYQLAQFNIALAKAEMNNALMRGFVERLDEINRLADHSPGFVWRLQGADGNATALRVFDNPNLLVNMSVWSSLETLKQYVYKSVHVELLRERAAWFDKLTVAHQVLWWIPAGHIPTIEEGKARLDYLQAHGPSPVAFNFAKAFAPAEAAH